MGAPAICCSTVDSGSLLYQRLLYLNFPEILVSHMVHQPRVSLSSADRQDWASATSRSVDNAASACLSGTLIPDYFRSNLGNPSPQQKHRCAMKISTILMVELSEGYCCRRFVFLRNAVMVPVVLL